MTSKYEAFVLAAETGSFKSTAEQLGYTQAGISYMMSSLESEMGTALFARDHSGVRLTEDGRNLLPWIQDVCTSERALQARLGEVRHLESGTVRVAAFASTAIRWLPGIVDEFTNAHPKVELEFACFEDQRAIEEGVLRGEFDCGFIVLPPREKFFVIPLVQDPIYVALAPHHPLAQEDFFPREALASEPYIKIRNPGYSEYDAVFDRHEVVPRTRFVMDNDFAVMGMVNKGLGYSLFPKLILRKASLRASSWRFPPTANLESPCGHGTAHPWPRKPSLKPFEPGLPPGTSALNSMNAGTIWDSSKHRTRKSFRIRNAAEAQCPGRVRYFEIVPARRCRDYAGNRGASPRA